MLYSNGRSFVRCGAVACAMALLFCCNTGDLYGKTDAISNSYFFISDFIDGSVHETDYSPIDIYSELDYYIYRAEHNRICKSIVETVLLDTEEQIEEEIREGEMELLAQLIEAEAGNQDYYGKCLVADVAYNRVESDRFPDSIEEVIFQKGQFACINDGGFDKAGWNISEESYQAAYQEYYNRLDYDILFFTAGGYNRYCEPMYKYGDHYFGK